MNLRNQIEAHYYIFVKGQVSMSLKWTCSHKNDTEFEHNFEPTTWRHFDWGEGENKVEVQIIIPKVWKGSRGNWGMRCGMWNTPTFVTLENNDEYFGGLYLTYRENFWVGFWLGNCSFHPPTATTTTIFAMVAVSLSLPPCPHFHPFSHSSATTSRNSLQRAGDAVILNRW